VTLTFICELDLKILKVHLHTKNELSRPRLSFTQVIIHNTQEAQLPQEIARVGSYYKLNSVSPVLRLSYSICQIIAFDKEMPDLVNALVLGNLFEYCQGAILSQTEWVDLKPLQRNWPQSY